MDMFTKKIIVTFDEVDSTYEVKVSNSKTGDSFYADCKSLPQVFEFISSIVKHKIVWVVK